MWLEASNVSAFEEWTGQRQLSSYGTNSGADTIPFQSWRHFKEAFAPELVRRAISLSPIKVARCLDPFGGSGTTALASQFLGVHPITIEVNPYLADLIAAKLCTYSDAKLAADFKALLIRARHLRVHRALKSFPGPRTFVHPGVNGRFLYARDVAERIWQYQVAISRIEHIKHRRLFRALLGGILVDLSNTVVSGKGRRYRRNWQDRIRTSEDVDLEFCASFERALADISKFGSRPCRTFKILRGDARHVIRRAGEFDLAVFSPPYPNSFDYTDVYNIELWMLGYLKDAHQNRKLRKKTLCSHLQVDRDFGFTATESPSLARCLRKLSRELDVLWDRRIPKMIAGYFSDMECVLGQIYKSLKKGGQVWLVIGDSRYAGVRVSTAQILAELAENIGFAVERLEPCRSMQGSPQQDWQRLSEVLLVLQH